MITLGYHSAILPESSLADVLSTAKRIGYETVEAMAWPPGKAERRYAGVCHIDVTGGSASLAEARRMNLSLPGLALAEQLYQSVAARGGARKGTQALARTIAELSNVTLTDS